MSQFTPIASLIGGALIGLSTSTLLLFNGRIAGISGIVGGLLQPSQGDTSWRGLFILGMMAAPLVLLAAGRLPQMTTVASDRTLVLAGLLVGFGTRLGSGCTSGHGVCGLARRSKRSLVATLVFMASGALTVWIVRHVIGGAR